MLRFGKKRNIIMALTCLIILTGCGKTDQQNIGSEELFSEVTTEKTDSVLAETISVGGGVVSTDDNVTFVYNGEPITFEYFLESDGECSMGLKIFVNGRLQSYEADGVETTMQTVELNKETKTMQISLEPNCGKKGETLQLLFINVFNPVVMKPDENGNVVFGNNQKMTSPIFWYINMEEDCREEVVQSEYAEETVVHRIFSEEEREAFITTDLSGNYKDKLDYLHLELYQGEEMLLEPVIHCEQDKNLTLKLYGGESGTYRVSFYSNFEQIPVNGQEYVDIEVREGEESSYEFYMQDIPQDSNFYVMAVSIDDLESWEKSSSYYISK